MKVVYFIQSHKNPEQICRLVTVIKKSSTNSLVLISHDFNCCQLDLGNLEKQFSGIEIIRRNKSARRGDSSVLEIYLNAIDYLYEHNYDFDWLICLSGQDYPIQPISQIETFLAQTEYDGFINYWDVLSEASPWRQQAGQKRFFSQYISLPVWTKWWLRKISRLEPFVPSFKVQWRFALIGWEAKSVPFTDDFKCYGGWYWNTLSRKCIDFLRNYLEEHPKLWKFYQKTLAPEESLIATVLVNSNQFDLCNDCLRYLDFPSQLFGYAQSLTVDDYDEIIRSNSHFARKFESESDHEILDLLDVYDYEQFPTKPTLDIEAWYENTNLGGGTPATSYNVRRRAYFSIFAGGFGHSYGGSGVWDAMSDFEQALELEGSTHIGYLSQLLHALGSDFLKLRPNQSMIVNGQSNNYDRHIQATSANDGSYALVYTAGTGEFSLYLSALKEESISVIWFNPRTKELSDRSTVKKSTDANFTTPGEGDWVLVLGR